MVASVFFDLLVRIMKMIDQRVLSLCVAMTLFAAGIGQSSIIYQDDFEGDAGSLIQGRSPDAVDATGTTYTTIGSPNQLQLNGAGSVVTIGRGGIMHILLPEISEGDVITLTAQVRPFSTADNWIGLGFTDGEADLVQSGVAWVLLNGDGSKNKGKIVVRSGLGESGMLYKSLSCEPTWVDGVPSTLIIVYNTRTGNLQVSLGGSNLFERLISYNDIAETPAPLSSLSHVTIQWFNQNSRDMPDPGCLDSLQVEIDPAVTP